MLVFVPGLQGPVWKVSILAAWRLSYIRRKKNDRYLPDRICIIHGAHNLKALGTSTTPCSVHNLDRPDFQGIGVILSSYRGSRLDAYLEVELWIQEGKLNESSSPYITIVKNNRSILFTIYLYSDSRIHPRSSRVYLHAAMREIQTSSRSKWC
jgi:hypothetical protein